MWNRLSQPGRPPAGRPDVRPDRAEGVAGSGTPTKEAQLLGLLRARAASKRERRWSPRFSAVEHRAWLGWWRTEGAYSIVAARLLDVSRGGARVVLAEAPPEDHPVWVCLGAPRPIDCVRGITLEVRLEREGGYGVRVRFVGSCPDVFYRAAVHGLGLETGRPGS